LIVAAARCLAYPVVVDGPRAHHRILPLLLSVVLAILTSACDGPPSVRGLELVNPTDMRLYVRLDGEPYLSEHAPWIRAGGTLRVSHFRSEWRQPRLMQAFDEQGELRFERTLTEADLDAANWRVVLQGDQRPPSP
jgi:hypothetical protein